MNWLILFVVISIVVTVLTFVESKSIENGLSVNDSNGIPLTNNNNNNNNISTNTENIVSRETINHVRHQHHQQIGNVQIITEIDIKNLVSILNTSVTATPNDPKQFGYAILTADETKDSTVNMDQNEKQFKRLDRIKNDDYKPFKFPEQFEHSRRVRWPSDHPHPNNNNNINAFEVVSKSNEMPTHKLLIRFPTSELELENGSPLPETNNNKVSIFTANDPMLMAVRPLLTTSNILNNNPNTNANDLDHNNNNEIWTVNQTAIDNGFEPLIYIDNGIFKVKYVAKGENSTTITMDVDLNDASSINSVKETAIILNDKQPPTKLNNNKLTPTNAQIIIIRNNTVQSYNGTTPTKGTSLIFEKDEDEQIQPQTPSNGKRKPRPFTFDGLPIFV